MKEIPSRFTFTERFDQHSFLLNQEQQIILSSSDLDTIRRMAIGLRHVTGDNELHDNISAITNNIPLYGDAVSLPSVFESYKNDTSSDESIAKKFSNSLISFVYRMGVVFDHDKYTQNDNSDDIVFPTLSSKLISTRFILMVGYIPTISQAHRFEFSTYGGFGKCGKSNLSEISAWKGGNKIIIPILPDLASISQNAKKEYQRMMDTGDMSSIRTYEYLIPISQKDNPTFLKPFAIQAALETSIATNFYTTISSRLKDLVKDIK